MTQTANPTADRPAATAPADDRERALHHYYLCCVSRACSVRARKEVLTGKAKFGIIGDGKELPQVALATQFAPGDWRSGYYRDQTLLLALELATPRELFAQLYADSDNDPYSGGRQMNSHFATPTVGSDGELLDLAARRNISADISSTGGQMARGLGLAFASKKFRELPGATLDGALSDDGNEVCWVTIGDASTSEGCFWEALNAAGVLQVPMVVSVWDDGYGISVPIEYQTTKGSISAAVAGMQRDGEADGIEIVRVPAWDYRALLDAYARAAELARREHVPVLVHVTEVTQQLGHSTSGSHERYKSPERLAFEQEYDCNRRFGEYLVREGIATPEQLAALETRANDDVDEQVAEAWAAVRARANAYRDELTGALGADHEGLRALKAARQPDYHEVLATARRIVLQAKLADERVPPAVHDLIERLEAKGEHDFSTALYQARDAGVLSVAPVAAEYADDATAQPGFQLLNTFFDALFERDGRVLAFGEDVGHIGDVNQGFAGLQDKYGEERVFDTGIREWTIVGQAIGLALRGFRPIAEVQYLDYLIYALSPLSDDLATTLYRTDGQQIAPAIIRTRGHRLEGIWHSGSPLGMMIHALRGIVLCVPRNMLQAVGMYNALLKANEPGIVVERLNAYRLRERVPANLADYTVAIGQPEVLREGDRLTVLTYGACTTICEQAIELLGDHGAGIALVDAQTLLPFDVDAMVAAHVAETNRLLIVDEDVPGGASAYLLAEVLDTQGAYRHLDAAPRCLTAKPHRPPYGSDGDYFSKPNPEQVAAVMLEMLGE